MKKFVLLVSGLLVGGNMLFAGYMPHVQRVENTDEAISNAYTYTLSVASGVISTIALNADRKSIEILNTSDSLKCYVVVGDYNINVSTIIQANGWVINESTNTGNSFKLSNYNGKLSLSGPVDSATDVDVRVLELWK